MPMEADTERGGHIVAIDHVQLAMPAGGEDEARRFYGDVLGLVEVPKPAGLAGRGGCWFAGVNGDAAVHLGVEDDFRPATKAHVAFLVGDLEATRRGLSSVGAHVTDDASLPTIRRLYTSDPFGNRIELIAEADGGFSLRAMSDDR